MSLDDLEPSYIRMIVNILENAHSDTVDFRKPILRLSIRYVYPLFIFLYGLVAIIGTVGNGLVIYFLIKKRLPDPTHYCICNLAVSDIIKCLVVMPMTLTNLLIKNWIYGSFLCFFLPMLQYFPVHVSTLTYLTIAVDRYRLILHPFKNRIPSGLCIIGVWVLALCLVLPYVIYVKYIDLELHLGEQFEGVGLCVVNQERNIEEYTRAMFVSLYAVPLAIIAFLCVKISTEIKARDVPPNVVRFASTLSEVNTDDDSGYAARSRSHSVPEGMSKKMLAPLDVSGQIHKHSDESCDNSEKRFREAAFIQTALNSTEEFDARIERRTQKYLITMVTLFAACWCPLNILTLVTHFLLETDDNTSYFDITFLTFAWIGFLSTCINPFLFASWTISQDTKMRLRGYLRFGSRRSSSICDDRSNVAYFGSFQDQPHRQQHRQSNT